VGKLYRSRKKRQQHKAVILKNEEMEEIASMKKEKPRQQKLGSNKD